MMVLLERLTIHFHARSILSLYTTVVSYLDFRHFRTNGIPRNAHIMDESGDGESLRYMQRQSPYSHK